MADGPLRFICRKQSCPKELKTSKNVDERSLALPVEEEVLNISAVATRALARRGRVEEDFFTVNESQVFVTFVTSDFLVGTFQRKVRLRFMIEERGLPCLCVMAAGAIFCPAVFRELAGMNVLMTPHASGWRRRE